MSLDKIGATGQVKQSPPLLLCLDLEEGSEALARYAAGIADRCGQKIFVFYVEPAGGTSVITNAKSSLEKLVAKTIPETNFGKIVMRQGLAEDEIIAYAGQNNFNPIVLGRRQRSAVERIYVGSTTSAVLSLTSSPVLVVPLSAEGIH